MNFSTSNRFNSFYDDDEEDTGNAFKTMKPKKKEKTSKDDERFKFKSSYFAEEKKEKKEEFNMEASAFPELATPTSITPSTPTKEKNFLNTLNKRQEIKVELPPLETINSRWVTVTRNKKTGKLTLFDPSLYNNTLTDEQLQKRESKLVVKVLTNLHMKRTKEYIDAWGKEEHYRTFYSSRL
jgi:hypothetical protein